VLLTLWFIFCKLEWLLIKNKQRMIKVNNAASFNEEVINEAEKTVLVDFYAEWCMPCKMMEPVLEQFSKENQEVKVVKVNVDESQDLAQKYNVMSIPTLYVFKKGQVQKQMMGVKTQQALEEAVR
jgi:thioredoxin 1